MKDMKTIRVKICGMRDADNMAQVATAVPDYMGFIFYAQSPRFVGQDFHISEGLSSNIKRVGVFVNERTPVIIELVRKHSLDYVQLHGSESVEQVIALRNEAINVIKVFSIDDDFNFSITAPYKPHVNFFLFDTKGKYHGGNAVTFNWEILKGYDQEVPFFLSGGITPAHVMAIGQLKGLNLHAIDVNSGVEERPGVKAMNEIESLFAAVHKLQTLNQ